tara:strand:+ start:649 stop:1584 length:936 start_codon:yes stop_codon:yes gene_type:complete
MAITLDGTTGIASVDGSASSPSVRGADSNSGIVYAADEVKISTGGTERAKVNSSGHFLPGAADTYDLGANTTPWRNIWMENDLYIEDNGMAVFGTGEDLKIYHDGSNNEIKNITGDLFIRSNSAGDKAIAVRNNAGVDLYFDNTKTFNTVAGGTQVPASHKIYVGAYNNNNGFANFSDGSGSATLYVGNQSISTSSDQRLKTDIVNTALNATTKLKQVRVVDFKWNDPSDKAINNKNSRGLWTGTLAQEIVDIFPHAVNAPRPEGTNIDTSSPDTWGMEYQHLVPVLIKGFQEQQAEIETLKTKVAALEAA